MSKLTVRSFLNKSLYITDNDGYEALIPWGMYIVEKIDNTSHIQFSYYDPETQTGTVYSYRDGTWVRDDDDEYSYNVEFV